MPAIVGGSQGRGFCLLSLDPDILYMGKCVKDCCKHMTNTMKTVEKTRDSGRPTRPSG